MVTVLFFSGMVATDLAIITELFCPKQGVQIFTMSFRGYCFLALF